MWFALYLFCSSHHSLALGYVLIFPPSLPCMILLEGFTVSSAFDASTCWSHDIPPHSLQVQKCHQTGETSLTKSWPFTIYPSYFIFKGTLKASWSQGLCIMDHLRDPDTQVYVESIIEWSRIFLVRLLCQVQPGISVFHSMLWCIHVGSCHVSLCGFWWWSSLKKAFSLYLYFLDI